MDWTTIITTFLSSGVFLGLFLITERKTSAAMKNTQSQSAEWQKLYEEEKSLRQKLQQYNQSADTSGKEDEKSDWDIAMQIASDVLN